MSARHIKHIVTGQRASDGAGVKLLRVISPSPRLDPFLLLDEFGSEEATDYIAGFPAHPHRGFETVTYMLDGHMRHEDHLGNRGELTSGGVQWMTAGRGVIHSEMPQQEEGRMRGFQLWLNLPAAEKMKPAGYRDIPAQDIPVKALPGARVKVIAGRPRLGDEDVTGAVHGISTEPLYLDVVLEAGASLTVPVTASHTALVYAYEGAPRVGGGALARGQLAVLGDGDAIELAAGEAEARMLVLAAKPLGEPIVHYGPFVMNSVEEIEQALRDYRDGRLAG